MKKILCLLTAIFLASSAFSEKIPKTTIEATKMRHFYGERISITPNDKTVTITKDKITIAPKDEGVMYTISGYFNGQIVNKTKNTVLKLDRVYLENTKGDPVIYGEAKTEISTSTDTKNYIVASGKPDPRTKSKSKPAAIYCKKNLELGGSGSLYVVGDVYHGVKADDVKMKGSGNFYIQGTKNGSAINCENFLVEKDKRFKAYLLNSKNAIKADYTISIQSGMFYIYNNETAFKTDTKKDDPKNPHSVTLSGDTMVFTTPDTEIYETEKNAYNKADGVVVSDTNLRYDRTF